MIKAWLKSALDDKPDRISWHLKKVKQEENNYYRSHTPQGVLTSYSSTSQTSIWNKSPEDLVKMISIWGRAWDWTSNKLPGGPDAAGSRPALWILRAHKWAFTSYGITCYCLKFFCEYAYGNYFLRKGPTVLTKFSRVGVAISDKARRNWNSQGRWRRKINCIAN
jgi:hypothetical protein